MMMTKGSAVGRALFFSRGIIHDYLLAYCDHCSMTDAVGASIRVHWYPSRSIRFHCGEMNLDAGPSCFDLSLLLWASGLIEDSDEDVGELGVNYSGGSKTTAGERKSPLDLGFKGRNSAVKGNQLLPFGYLASNWAS